MRERVTAMLSTTASDQLYYDGQRLFHEPNSRHACAAKHFQQAVEEFSHGQAANMLAYMHQNGMGVKRNIDLSNEYALIAMIAGVHTPTVPVHPLLKIIFEAATHKLFSDDEIKTIPPQILVPKVMCEIRRVTR